MDGVFKGEMAATWMGGEMSGRISMGMLYIRWRGAICFDMQECWIVDCFVYNTEGWP